MTPPSTRPPGGARSRPLRLHHANASARGHAPGLLGRGPASRAGDGEANPSVAERKRVLIVEDDPTSRNTLRLLCSLSGLNPVPTATVAEAVNHLAGNPDFLILDLMLPDGNGTEVLRRIRAAGMQTSVAVTTGASDPNLLADVERLRPDRLFTKPVDWDYLRSWLASA